MRLVDDIRYQFPCLINHDLMNEMSLVNFNENYMASIRPRISGHFASFMWDTDSLKEQFIANNLRGHSA